MAVATILKRGEGDDMDDKNDPVEKQARDLMFSELSELGDLLYKATQEWEDSIKGETRYLLALLEEVGEHHRLTDWTWSAIANRSDDLGPALNRAYAIATATAAPALLAWVRTIRATPGGDELLEGALFADDGEVDHAMLAGIFASAGISGAFHFGKSRPDPEQPPTPMDAAVAA